MTFNLPALPIHPAANLFPQMGADEMTALIADIHRQGLITPIVIYRGAILDGRHRYEAIRQLYERGIEVQPCFTEYDGDEPFQFVLSVNLHRRHLTVSQKAAIGVAFKEQFQANGIQRGRPKDGTPAGIRGEARQLAAAAVGVSARVIDYAESVRDKAPDLFEAMQAGEVSVWKAMERIEERETPPSPATTPTDPLTDALTAEDEAERPSEHIRDATDMFASCNLQETASVPAPSCCPHCGRPL